MFYMGIVILQDIQMDDKIQFHYWVQLDSGGVDHWYPYRKVYEFWQLYKIYQG